MGSLEFLQERALRKQGVVYNQETADTCVAIRLRYIGTGTVTSVTVTTAVDIALVTSDGGTDTYTFADYATVGALVDAINGGLSTENIAAGAYTIPFEAKVLDSLRSKATASQFVDGAITAGTYFGKTVWDVLVDTDAADYHAFRLTYFRGFDKPHKLNHRVHLAEIKYLVNLSGGGVGTLQIYDTVYRIDNHSASNEEVLVYNVVAVDNVATTVRWLSGDAYITAKEGHELVAVLTDSTDFTDTAPYLRIAGYIE